MRYIYTRLCSYTRLIFNPADDHLLSYINDGIYLVLSFPFSFLFFFSSSSFFLFFSLSFFLPLSSLSPLPVMTRINVTWRTVGRTGVVLAWDRVDLVLFPFCNKELVSFLVGKMGGNYWKPYPLINCIEYCPIIPMVLVNDKRTQPSW